MNHVVECPVCRYKKTYDMKKNADYHERQIKKARAALPEIASLESENKALREMLKHRCACGATLVHAPDCKLFALLQEE